MSTLMGKCYFYRKMLFYRKMSFFTGKFYFLPENVIFTGKCYFYGENVYFYRIFFNFILLLESQYRNSSVPKSILVSQSRKILVSEPELGKNSGKSLISKTIRESGICLLSSSCSTAKVIKEI